MEKIKEARLFAIEKHGKQKYGEHDYVKHLDDVYLILKEWGLPEKFLIASYLHDTMEDVGVNIKELTEKFGSDVAILVFAVTGRGKNRKERMADIADKFVIFPDAFPLKAGDRYANILNCMAEKNESLIEMYRKEMPLLENNAPSGSEIYLDKLKDLFVKYDSGVLVRKKHNF